MTDKFEQKLHGEWAVPRTDILNSFEIAPLRELDASQPIRPEQALKYLKISEDELIELLKTGELPRPGKQTKGRVAWRFDEVRALAPLRDR
jgi:predicted DNA-binding transcriptional regulator AlpA